MEKVVEVKDIMKKFGKKQVLYGCSLEVMPGEWVSIAGENGSGKTTLLSIMTGTLSADAGSVSYYGKSLKCIDLAHLVGYVPQENPLIPELTVQDHLKLWYYGKNAKEDLAKMAKQFRLEEVMKMPIKKLSGGTKRRVSLACAMVNAPSVLILDEPCAALDLICKKEIHCFLMEHIKRNGSIIMCTHDESELGMSHKCYKMENGILREETGKA